MTEVKCKVKSCYYYGDGDICKAETIMVDNNRLVGSKARMEVGDLNLNTRRSRRDRDSEFGDLTPDYRRQRTRNVEYGDVNRDRTSRLGDYEIGDLGAERVTGRGSENFGGDLLKENAGSGAQASTSEETLCRTFRPHGTPPRH